MTIHQLKPLSPADVQGEFVDYVAGFEGMGRRTDVFSHDGIRYFVNEFWTSRQRQSHNLHEISYRACFKAELPRFFIEYLTAPGELVYDPFMGRGTTLLEAHLLGRAVAGNDVNPLSRMLVEPRLQAPDLQTVEQRLAELDLSGAEADDADPLLVFYHPRTLAEINGLKRWFAARQETGGLDLTDKWIRMVALNRLTGHSSGFFSVYTLPPNQAVSVESQRKINLKRDQVPDYRDTKKIILKKSRSLLKMGSGGRLAAEPILSTGAASQTSHLADASVSLIVTSPPFLDVVNYQQDNWLRCWFAGIDADTVKIDKHRTLDDWEGFVRRSFEEFVRVVKPGGHIAFEVGEVRHGTVLLERHVAKAVAGLPLDLLGVIVNDQDFTKTANCWGVDNNKGGTNTNRICLFRRT